MLLLKTAIVQYIPVDADRSGLDLHHIKRGLAPPTTDRLERVEQALRMDKPVVNLLFRETAPITQLSLSHRQKHIKCQIPLQIAPLELQYSTWMSTQNLAIPPLPFLKETLKLLAGNIFQIFPKYVSLLLD